MNIHSSQAVKRTPALFLQAIIVVAGIAVFAALLIGPQLEGRNTHSTLFQTYFTDPFLAYVYLASIPFFVAIYQALKVLEYLKSNRVFSQSAAKALRTIKYCAIIIAGSTIAADVYIRIAARTSHDDPAGAIMLGVIVIFLSIVVAAAAGVFESVLQNGIFIKSKK